MLPLTFADPADYDKVQPSDRVSLLGLDNLSPGQVVLPFWWPLILGRNRSFFIRHDSIPYLYDIVYCYLSVFSSLYAVY